ncbi:MAG TPA: cupin domain-containing protein [Rhizobiaceae bacterium]
MNVIEGKSKHVVSLHSQEPRFEGPKGAIRHMDASDLPIMRKLSLRLLSLAFQGVREPHWHANANELGYCIQGEALITIADNHARRENFIVQAGEMFFIPSGAMHSIKNIGTGRAEFALAFSHERPEDFGIKAAFGAMSNAVLGNSYDLPSAAFDGFDPAAAGSPVFSVASLNGIEDQARHVNPYKFSLEATPPQIISSAGSAHTGKAPLWPALRDIAMFSVRITDVGMREPHWHPETAEMGYVLSGQARMTILDPDGSTDTYLIGPGDAYFIPRAYPHHIENVGTGTFHVLIFFDRTEPGDIGYRSLINVYPRDLIAAALGMTEADLPNFPFTQIDPLLVPRVNAVDSVR